MPRIDRAQKFLIDPLAVTRDPARRAMSPAAQGVYDTLWLESWMEKEPGVLPADERLLARLAMVSDEVWASVVDEVRTGFRTSEDTWICAAVLSTKASQDMARTRWRNSKRKQRMRDVDSPRLSNVQSSVSTGSGSGSVQNKKKKVLGSSSILPDDAPPLAALGASAALALDHGSQPATPAPHGFGKSERCTCRLCGAQFVRPAKSRQNLCAPCFAASQSDPSSNTGTPF